MRLFTLILVLLLGMLQYHLWQGKNGLSDYTRLKTEVSEQQQGNGKLQKRNALMYEEIADLKKGGEAVEERARNELGLIKDSETFYRIIPKRSN